MSYCFCIGSKGYQRNLLGYLLAAFVFLLGCSQKPREQKDSPLSVVTSFSKTSLINLSENFISTYNYNCCLQVISDSLLIGYNNARKSLDIISIDGRKPHKQWFLQGEGPHYIGELRALRYISNSQILLLTKNYLYEAELPNGSNYLTVKAKYSLVNSAKHAIKGFNYDQYQAEFINNSMIFDGTAPLIAYDPLENRVFIRQYGVIPDNQLDYYQYPIGGWLYLNTGQYQEANDIYYPDFIRNNGPNLPFHYTMLPTWTENGLIYNFPVLPDIFKYQNGQITSYVSSKSKVNFIAKPLEDFNGISFSDLESSTKGILFFDHTRQHFPVVWDKYRKLFYRISKSNTSEDQRPSRNYRIRRFGHHTISVFDEYFNLIAENDLPESFDACILVSKSNLYFPLKNPVSENSFQLGIMKIDF